MPMFRLVVPTLLVAVLLVFVSGVVQAQSAGLDQLQPPRPIWAFEGDTDNLRRHLRGWVGLSESQLIEKTRSELESGRGRSRHTARQRVDDTAVRLITMWRQTGDSTYRDDALIVLDTAIADAREFEPDWTITSDGGKDDRHYLLRDVTLEYALRWAITGNSADADQAVALLEQFAAAFPQWPVLFDRPNRWKQRAWVSVDHSRIYNDWAAGGKWGQWHWLDLFGSYPLLRAYDLTCERMSESQRQAIRSNIFDHHAEVVSRWEINFFNCLGYRLRGLARFGLVLEDPLYIHHVVDYARDWAYTGFFPDGFWHETTPAYHNQVVASLRSRIPAKVDGWSDPEGFTHPVTGRRLDNVDLAGEFAHHYQRWDQAMFKVKLPNGYQAALNDTDPHRYRVGPDKQVSEPLLLGTSGYAIAGFGDGDPQQQTQLYLMFPGTHGHEHYNILNILWYGHGRELFDETRYRPMPGSSSTRSWHMASAAHNLVVIDDRDQVGRFTDRLPFSQDDEIRGHVDWPLRDRYGGTRNHGNLRLFDATWPEVQVMEAEGENAHRPRPDLYRRTVMLVDLGEGNSYIVDIFRVAGGESHHDYMLHGALALPYELSFDTPMQSATGTLHDHIQLQRQAKPTSGWSATFSYEDGVATRSHFLAPHNVTVLAGKAPAINRVGEADFLAVRHNATESVFIVVHEAYRDQPRIDSVELLTDPGQGASIAVRVHLGDRADTFFSAMENTTIDVQDPQGQLLTFQGKLGYTRHLDGQASHAHLFDGSLIRQRGNRLLVHDETPPLTGRVLQTMRTEAGDAANALVTDAQVPNAGSLIGKTVMVDMGGRITWSYKITGVQREAGHSIIELEHEPGFEIRDGGSLINMLFFPGWGIRGQATFTIVQPAHWAR